MTAGLILAGGAGTRFGGVDKAFLPLAGQPLIAHLLARLAPQVSALAISANGDAARFARFNVPVLPDGIHAGRGPLAGVAAGLAWAAALGAKALLTVPVDTPFIPETLAALLHPAPAAAVHNDRQHHLVALWPISFLPGLTRFLDQPGPHPVRAALASAGARAQIFESAADPFLNINTETDLAAAQLMPAPPLGPPVASG